MLAAHLPDDQPANDHRKVSARLRLLAAPVADNILRVCLTEGDALSSSALVLERFTGYPVTEVTQDQMLGGFHCALTPGQGTGFTLGRILSGELITIAGASLESVDLVRYDTGGELPQIAVRKTVDGERTFIDNLSPHVVGQTYTGELRISLAPQEEIYGFGQDEEGGYGRRGTRLPLYQHNMRTPMPCLVSDRGYGVLFDCASLMIFDDTGEFTRVEFDAVPAIDFYLIAGDPSDVVRGFRKLTGSAPLLPKWAYGYLQSKERYRSADELVAVARRHRELDIPLDGVIQDWKTWPGEEWGQKTLDPVRYPEPLELRRSLEELQVHSMVSVWPNMASGCADHTQFAEAGLLLGDYSTYDAFDPRARDLYWTQLTTVLYRAFDSWWCDSTEPFAGPDWQGSELLPPNVRYEMVGGEHRRYLGAERANLYAVAHARGIYEHERAEQSAGTGPVRRVLNLTRSGYPGIQQYGAVLWSGDVSATWSALRAEVAKAISMGLSGVPWWTTDAGAFFVGGVECWRRWCGDPQAEPVWFWHGDYDQGVADPRYRELYVRWLQFAGFLPLFRSHGTDTPREIWNFGTPGEPAYDSIAATIRLRYRLLPYVYATAARAALDDEVMVRALLFDFGDDSVARKVDDQFLLGKSLMACPVLQPVTVPEEPAGCLGATRSCYLPSGAQWYDFWTDERFPGGLQLEAVAPLDKMPVFVRAGSVLPLQHQVAHALANRDRFEIVIYPGEDGEGELYDDDGLTYAYESGEYSRVHFGWTDKARELRIEASTWTRLRPLEFELRLADERNKIDFDGTPVTVRF